MQLRLKTTVVTSKIALLIKLDRKSKKRVAFQLII